MKDFIESLAEYGVNINYFDTEEAAFQLCDALKITVDENQEFTAHLLIDGERYIALKKGLRGINKVFAILHEIAHVWLDGGNEIDSIYFLGGGDAKLELQADILATVLMIPKKGLKTHDFLEWHPNKQARQFYEDRKKIEFLYEI